MAIVLAFAGAACVVVDDRLPRPSNGDYYGSAYYAVEELDYIIDDFGFSQTALCTNNVQFEGWFDATCDALIQSKERSAYLYCDYYDAAGFYHSYDASFYFPRGYIAEYCTFGKATPVATAKASDDVAIDPATQPVVNDGNLHAVISERTGKHQVKESLGKNITAEEFLTNHGALTRTRNTEKPIEKLFTKENLPK
jgi:uncharacterized protein YutD